VVLLALAVAAVVTLCVTGGGFRRRARPGGRLNPAGRPRAGEPMAESLEGLLALKLAAGHLSREQYRRAMEVIAVDDDERHRLEAPPDTTPPDGNAPVTGA
jgi:hypothetical protein